MKRKKVILFLLMISLMFVGMIGIKADIWYNPQKVGNVWDSFYYPYGKTIADLAPNAPVATCANWGISTEYDKCTAACGTGLCVRVGSPQRYQITNMTTGGSPKPAFCLDGLVHLDTGIDYQYTEDNTSPLQINVGMSCALVDLYKAIYKDKTIDASLTFKSNGYLDIAAIPDNVIRPLQEAVWSHQYDSERCEDAKNSDFAIFDVTNGTGSISLQTMTNTKLSYNTTSGKYVSQAIKVTANSIEPGTNVTYAITGAPTGVFLSTNKDATSPSAAIPSSGVASGTSVYLVVPTESIASSTSIKVTATASVFTKTETKLKATFQKLVYTGSVASDNLSQDLGIPELYKEEVKKYENKSVLVTLTPNVGSISFIKKDYNTKEVIPEIEFKLFRANSTVPIDTKTTDSNGKITFSNLTIGATYTIVEQSNVPGYLGGYTYTFTLGAGGSEPANGAQLVIYNTPRKIVIEKKDLRAGTLLTGSDLKLYNCTNSSLGNEVSIGWTNSLDRKSFNIEQGYYCLVETITPTGYQDNKQVFRFKVEDVSNSYRIVKENLYTLNGTALTLIPESSQESDIYVISTDNKKITVNNKKLTKISKQSIVGSDELPGASIQLYKYDSGIKNYKRYMNWVSDSTAKEIYLEVGTYIFEETVAPVGYKKIKNAVAFKVAADGKISIVTKNNDGKTEAIGSVSQASTNGVYKFTYSDKPKKCIKKSDTECINIFNIENNGESIVIKNEPMKLKISKKDIVGSKEIDGSTIVITNDKDSTYKKTLYPKKGEKTEFELSYLEPEGTTKYYYYLEETVAPKGYKKLTTVFKFSVDEYGVPTLVGIGKWDKNKKFNQTKKVSTHDNIKLSEDEIAVLNEPIKIILSKKDSTSSKFIKGAKIVITPEDKELAPLEIETNDKEMELNLVPGIYYIKETEAPEGYEKLDFEYKIEILDDGNIKLLSENAENISIKDNSIILYNTKVVVEKTGLSISPFTISGVVLLIVAGVLTLIAVKKRRV